MRSHRRWLVVLSIMAIAMVLCAVATQQLLTKPAPPPWPPRMPRETANVLRNGIGLLFALHAGVALFVTRRWHRVAVPGRAALRALLSVGLSFPVLFWGGMVLACLVVRALPIRNARVEDQISRVATYATMVTSSAAGAWWIARVLARLTGATNRLLCAAMVACGALWPFVLPLVYDARNDGVWAVWFRDPMGVGPLLAWQLAIGVAAAAWFVRAGDARSVGRDHLVALGSPAMLFPLIGVRLHGWLDDLVVLIYVAGAFALGLRGAALAIAGAGAGVHFALTRLTDYPQGAIKLIPFRVHAYIELAEGLAVLAASLAFAADRPIAQRLFLGAMAASQLGAFAFSNYDWPTTRPPAAARA